jgi:hypothetical protein
MNWKRKIVKGTYQKLRMDKAAVEKRKDIREKTLKWLMTCRLI